MMTGRWRQTLNFWLTNTWPRRRLSRWMGQISRWRSPWFTPAAIWIWNRFDPLELADSPPVRYASMHDCFTRAIRPETRPLDPRNGVLTSPCDGILGAHGRIEDDQLFQVKGKHYALTDLIGPVPSNHPWRTGYFVTIRIKSNMYHRFHAPGKGHLVESRYFPGDAWNVNPPTLERVDRLFVQNERACLTYVLEQGDAVALVPVAAILVAGIRVHALHHLLWMKPDVLLRLDQPVAYGKGEEMGWFEHGSTIVMIAPRHYELCPDFKSGDRLRMGQALLVRFQSSMPDPS